MKMKLRSLISIVALSVVIIGCTTTKRTETPPGSGNYQTNAIVDPRFESTISTIGAVNSATAGVNPFSPLISIGLGAATAIATWFAKRKNDQAAQSNLLLRTVVQGVEQSGSSEVKSAIEKHASRIGVEGSLGPTVAKINAGLQ